jgi:hypothetical protein
MILIIRNWVFSFLIEGNSFFEFDINFNPLQSSFYLIRLTVVKYYIYI